MPKYKNCSGSTYSFYGVVFHPWDVHEVPGTISHAKFVTTTEPETSAKTETVNTETTVDTQQTPSTETEDTKRSRKQRGE